MTWFEMFLTIMVSSAFLFVGLLCLFWPQALRDWNLKAEANAAKRLGRFYDPFPALRTRGRGGRPQPLWRIRIHGVVAMIAFIVILAALIMRACKGGN